MTMKAHKDNGLPTRGGLSIPRAPGVLPGHLLAGAFPALSLRIPFCAPASILPLIVFRFQA